jgi:hypothetical protein
MDQPGITRRGVLRGAILGAGALVVGGTAVASPLLSAAVSAAGMTKAVPASGFKFVQAAFTPLVGKAFKVKVNGTWRTIVLDAVLAKPGAGGERFSLLFDGLAPAFGQDTYQVQQASLGQFAMFVAPVDQPNRMQRYESVVNNRQPH